MANKSSAVSEWALDREIVLSRVFDAPRELVFRVWTDQEHFAKWFGPRGCVTTVREADIRALVADAAQVTGRTFIVDGRRLDRRKMMASRLPACV